MATKSGWLAPDEYRAAVRVGFTAMLLLGLSIPEQARVFSENAKTKRKLYVIKKELATPEFQNMDILDRVKYLASIHTLARRKFDTKVAVNRWVRTKVRKVSPMDLLTSGHLHHVVMVLLWIQKLNGIPQDPKLVEFVEVAEELLSRRT